VTSINIFGVGHFAKKRILSTFKYISFFLPFENVCFYTKIITNLDDISYNILNIVRILYGFSDTYISARKCLK